MAHTLAFLGKSGLAVRGLGARCPEAGFSWRPRGPARVPRPGRSAPGISIPSEDTPDTGFLGVELTMTVAVRVGWLPQVPTFLVAWLIHVESFRAMHLCRKCQVSVTVRSVSTGSSLFPLILFGGWGQSTMGPRARTPLERRLKRRGLAAVTLKSGRLDDAPGIRPSPSVSGQDSRKNLATWGRQEGGPLKLQSLLLIATLSPPHHLAGLLTLLRVSLWVPHSLTRQGK